ncbi:hypothetical protein FocnCong_v013276 [Fusarium oxysporum f. sp. conglutinans]|nr:hypothetical protein FocnCong_v013276 [Fusarium oxysporum f. sp. conglutinans]
MKYSRSRDATLTLRNLASAERCAPKRTDGDAGLPPPNERSGTQPTSPEKLRKRHAARRLFRESLSQPHVVLGTPIPPTQQSTRRFRALAPSPPVQPTAHPIASHSDPSTVRSSTTVWVTLTWLLGSTRAGRDSQDEPSKAVARAKQAAIQRDHRSRRRVGETVSLTPTISQLGVFGDFEGPGEDASQDRLQPSELLGGDEIRKEGDDRGQFSESDIDAEDYFNLLLSPARPRRYLKQLGVESDPDLGDEHENSDNDCVDGKPSSPSLAAAFRTAKAWSPWSCPWYRRAAEKISKASSIVDAATTYSESSDNSTRRIGGLHAQDPVWNGDLDACALTDRDKATLREFWTTLDNDQMEYCTRCQECWFQMKIDSDGICERCYRKDRKRRPDEPYFFSADNQLDFGPVPARLPQLTPYRGVFACPCSRPREHYACARAAVQVSRARGSLSPRGWLGVQPAPALPQELNTVLLRPANTSSHANLSRQFTRQFRVRRQPVVIWLDYLRRHHPGYRCVVIDEERLNQLPKMAMSWMLSPRRLRRARDALHDGVFARHPTFRFVAFNTLMRSKARSRSRFFVKQQDGRQQAADARATYSGAGTQRGPRGAGADQLDHKACGGLFAHMPQYDDWLAATEPERMALSRRLLRQNPHIAAFHFYRRYCLFRDIVLSKKFNITDYWDRYEWQGRGSPHNHGLYWMDSCPGTDMDDEAARDAKVIPERDPLSIEMTFLRLSQIVNRCQRHKCNTTYCLRVRKRTGDLARDMEGAAADIEAANVANPERECRFDFPRALRELAAVIRKEGRSYYVFEAARNDSLMNHFNPAIILGWLANIDISPCTSLQAVITYAAKYCSKSEKKTEPYCKLADQVLPHTAHLQPLLSFSSRLMNKLIAERDYSAQEISHLLLNIPLQEGTRMVVVVDCRPLELHGRSYRVDEDVIETVGSYRKYLERNDQHEDVTYLEYLQSYNLKTWRRLAANAKKRVLSYFPRYKSIEASPSLTTSAVLS